MKWTPGVKYGRLGDDEKCETESRLSNLQKRRRCLILAKTLCTICFAAALGMFGIYVAGYGSPDCGTTDNDPTNNLNNTFAPQCTPITDNQRIDCWPESGGVSEHKCVQRGCCWKIAEQSSPGLSGVPWCYYPTNFQGYTVVNVQTQPNGMKVQLQTTQPSWWPNEVQQVTLDIEYDTANRLHFKFYDPNNARYEVPLNLNKTTQHASVNEYMVEVPSSGQFYIKVTRRSTGKILFSTQDAAPLVFTDQYLQLGTQLSTKYIYGLGEHRSAFLQSTEWTKMAFWSRDQPPSLDTNLYGVHPFYLNIEDDHKSHGVFLLNSNAMEVELQPAPSLTYRTTGGVLDFYVFTGPTPDEVIQQYTALIGRPFMPPYWALGFHLCRWGFNGGSSGMKEVINRMRAANMPYDVQWNDIDYMRDHLDWTLDRNHFNDLPDIVADLHNHGQHYMMIVDPGISNTQPSGSYPPYDDGITKDVFIKKPDGSGPIIGKVWPGNTAFPDFFHPNAEQYWTQHAQTYHNIVPYDGIWIDMNEPSNFYAGSVDGCPDNTIENPPWLPPVLTGYTLRDKTLCATAKQHLSTHYNLHSLYGHSEAIATKSALDTILGNKRSLVISRSTYPGTGVHSGHWMGDNNAQWIDTYYSVTGMLNFNLFGIPMVGSDICGFNGNTNTELCTRWMQLGAFYPFMRNHNTIGNKDQDPAVFDATTQNIMRDALNLRYTLLPYLYTMFYRSHVDGTPIIRPLFYQYPSSTNNVVYSVDVQFMWGKSLLITPTTSQGTTQGQGYLPTDRWYDWFDHSYIDSPGHLINFSLPMEHINLKIRGDSIIPLQEPAVTTTLARKNKFMLLAALSSTGTASGELYWDDGESRDSISGGKYNLISFKVSQGTLTSVIQIGGYTSESMLLGEVQLLGVNTSPTTIVVNGRTLPSADYTYSNKVLTVKNLSENLLQKLTVTWK
ncbi:hypothetical protein ACF0H5_002731 [Mactra antiquata]